MPAVFRDIFRMVLDDDNRLSVMFVQLPEPVMTEQYGIGFRKGNTALRDAVQKTLKEMVADGSAARISARYFNGRNVLILKP